MNSLRPASPPRWHAMTTRSALETAAFDAIVNAARAAIEARGLFHLVLAGGETPRGVYARLCREVADFGAWRFYFGDERCAAPDDAERNSVMARGAGLDATRIPARHMHDIPGEAGAIEGARRYAATLAGVPEFDLVLLGLGEDGHTASLFPGQEWGVGSDAPDVLAVFNAPKPPPERISLSAHRLSRARAVWFLVSGESKRAAVAQWRSGARLPATSIDPPAGVDILVDANLIAPA